ncbi:cytochrome ubiquinol oxidase subunit I [Pseudomonas juntendi]|uniref:cytochrome ubiquinol oxidase subunit I n=1 Tax=Pseudomonas juntendi TaxID=2666183 RepID=UPI00320ABA0B
MVEFGDATTALLAARLQFAITISFHIVLAAFSIGLAQWLMVLEALWLYRRDKQLMAIYHFWLKVFALTLQWVVTQSRRATSQADGLVAGYQYPHL